MKRKRELILNDFRPRQMAGSNRVACTRCVGAIPPCVCVMHLAAVNADDALRCNRLPGAAGAAATAAAAAAAAAATAAAAAAACARQIE